MIDNRSGPYIYTYTGKKFYPLDSRPEDICIDDIAQGLSLTCRWTGQCNRFYSVATHSIRVAYIAKFLAERDGIRGEELEKVFSHALVHDAHEAYLADLASPLKQHVEGWKGFEKGIQESIHRFLGLDLELDEDLQRYVTWADLLCLCIEYEELFNNSDGYETLFFSSDASGLWPGFPTIDPSIRGIANAFGPINFPDPKSDLKERLIRVREVTSHGNVRPRVSEMQA